MELGEALLKQTEQVFVRIEDFEQGLGGCSIRG
jgi:hypothetical protein